MLYNSNFTPQGAPGNTFHGNFFFSHFQAATDRYRSWFTFWFSCHFSSRCSMERSIRLYSKTRSVRCRRSIPQVVQLALLEDTFWPRYAQNHSHLFRSCSNTWYHDSGVDNILQFTIFLANGSLVTTNSFQYPDLFWLLRGDSGGTYGVVTSITYQTYPIFPLTNVTLTTNFTSPLKM